MDKNEKQFEILLDILRRFHAAGILEQMMLIGSWCLYLYRLEFRNAEQIPPVRTMDVDFLIPSEGRISKEVDVPAILKQMGFVSTHNRASGMVVYDTPDLRVEFLVPELGRGLRKSPEIKKLHVKAHALRYLGLLGDHPRRVRYQGISVVVPEPAAYAFQKLIISQRRSKSEKKEKDLEGAIGVLDCVLALPSELTKAKSIFQALPKAWQRTILSVSQKHYPKLLDIEVNS